MIDIIDQQPPVTRDELGRIEAILIDQAKGKVIDPDSLAMLGLLSDFELKDAQARAENIVRLQGIAKPAAERAKDREALEKLENNVPIRLSIINEEIAKLQAEAKQLSSQLQQARALVKEQNEAIEKLIEAAPVHLRSKLVCLTREKVRSDHAIRTLGIDVYRMQLIEQLATKPVEDEPITLRLYLDEVGLPPIIKQNHAAVNKAGQNVMLWTVSPGDLKHPLIKTHLAKLNAQIESHKKNIERVEKELQPIRDFYVP